jgi:putative transcriptional regulator
MRNKEKSNKKEVSKGIITGLKEALDITREKKVAKRVREIVIPELPVYKGKEIKQVREKIDVTQKIFAEVFGVSLKTVEAWEGNRNVPEGPAQRIIYALDKNPKFLKTLGITV